MPRGRGGRILTQRSSRSARGQGKEEKDSDFASSQVGDQMDEVEKMESLFLKESKFQTHYDSQSKESGLYRASLHSLLTSKVTLSLGTKARILAASLSRKDVEL